MGPMNLATVPHPMASLYVGDLHPDVTESVLYELFSSYGCIISIRVCRDLVRKRSLGYAYINFQQPNEAQKAMEILNFEPVMGRPIRIMHWQRDPAIRKSGVGNVFIKNLDKSISNRSLYDTFSLFGPILSSKIVMDEKGSKGYGFVHFASEKAAQNCIEKTNGMLLIGKKMFVGKFIPRKDRIRSTNEGFTNVYVKNFADNLNDDSLRSLFEKFGTITSCKVITDSKGKSRGFGFVSFDKTNDAEKAVDEMNSKEINGRQLYASRAQTKRERESFLKDKFRRDYVQGGKKKVDRLQGTNLYVKNLDDSVDDETLRYHFSKYGTVTSAKVMMQDYHSKGFGFVCFSKPEDAAKAIMHMNKRIISSKPLYVSLAQKKEERREQLSSQFFLRNQMAWQFPVC